MDTRDESDTSSEVSAITMMRTRARRASGCRRSSESRCDESAIGTRSESDHELRMRVVVIARLLSRHQSSLAPLECERRSSLASVFVVQLQRPIHASLVSTSTALSSSKRPSLPLPVLASDLKISPRRIVRRQMDRSYDSEYSDEEQVDEKQERKAPPFFATADPLKIVEVTPELQEILERSVARYNKLQKSDHRQLEYGPDDIWPIQYAIANTFVKTTGITTLESGTNTGKTLTMIAAAELTTMCLVLVPGGSVFAQWIKYLDRYGLYNPLKPADSPWVIFSHQHAKGHLNYLSTPIEAKARTQKLRDRESLIVLCSTRNINEVMSTVFTPDVVAGREFTVIVDEAHLKIPMLKDWIQPEVRDPNDPESKGIITRELLASGSELTPKLLKANGIDTVDGVAQVDHAIKVNAVNTGPTDIWHIELMNTESYKDGNEWEWIDKVRDILEDGRRVVIFAQVEMQDMLLAHKADVFGDKEIFVQGAQQNTIPNFKKSANAVLLLTMRKSVGLNVDADTMIILNPGDSTTEVLIQATKRIIRAESSEETVDIFMLCGTPKEYYRVLYAKAFSLQEWRWGRQDVVNTSMVYKGIASMRLLGVNPEEVNRVDLCVFLADYAELSLIGKLDRPREQILEWWEANKTDDTVLTPQIIENLIVLE